MVKKGFYGLYKPNKKIFDRIGDYVLVMKDNYVLKDWVAGEDDDDFVAHHGGVSSQEMYVPLVVAKC